MALNLQKRNGQFTDRNNDYILFYLSYCNLSALTAILQVDLG